MIVAGGAKRANGATIANSDGGSLAWVARTHLR